MNAPSSLAEAFAERARRDPGALALFDVRTRLSYADLADRCGAEAASLAARGVSPGAHVGVALARSIDAVVAILATWWAGGVVVPIDPAWPPARRRFVADDAEIGWTIDAGPSVLPTTAPAAKRVGAPATLPSDAPALALYTSGSTGAPKAVLLSHSALLHRFRALALALPFAPGDVACHRAPPTFIDAYAEVFGPLLHGVPTCVLREPYSLEDLALARVSRLVIVPSLLSELVSAYPELGARAPALRLVVASGEALGAPLARRFYAAVPGALLVNVYGSTEVGGDATWWKVPRAVPDVVSIGAPLDGVTVHLLGERGAPVADGEPGELAIGGPMLALGYWRRTELTRERFVRERASGERVHRTGDRARRARDGTIELLGRLDDQVKIAGSRVDLREVEAALLALDGVTEAAAAVHHGDRARLVAAVVATSTITAATARAHVAARLPAAAVPSRIAILDAMPRGGHGKVDRRTVAAAAMHEDAGAIASPDDPLASRIATWFAEVTGLARAGPNDELEALGGDSLARLRLLAHLAREGISIAPADVPRPLTPGALAAVARSSRARVDPAPFLLDPEDARGLGVGVVDAFPLTDFQRVIALETLANAPSSVWSDQVAYSLAGPIDVGRLAEAWAGEIAARPSLRTSIAWRRLASPLQVVHTRVHFDLARLDLRHLDPAAYRQRVLAEEWGQMSTTFSLEEPPLFVARILLGPGERSDLVFTYHHVILDGDSARIVLRGVLDRYAGRAVAASSSSFRRFVERTRATGLSALWGELLAGVEPRALPALPSPLGMGDAAWRIFHRARDVRARIARLRVRTRAWREPGLRALLRREGVTPHPYSGGDIAAQRLPATFGRELRAWATAHRTTPAAVWATLYALHLGRERGERDVVFGVIVSGRDGETRDTVGMLANCLPLRVRIDAEGSIASLVRAVSSGLCDLEALALTPTLTLARRAGGAFLDTWFVSWGFAEDERWEPPPGVRVENGRGVTLASARLALMLSLQDGAPQLAVGSDAFHSTGRALVHLLALADALLVAPPEARVAELLALSAPDGGMVVGLPGL